MAASTSYSTAADSKNSYSYDVFINHRGPDVKLTLASHLYHRLISHGLKAFLDQDELQAGRNFDSQIKEAIRTASIHVAIFSPRYAESEWCMKELELMLESWDTGKSVIIPVFHHVKPADVRRTRGEGVYAQALRDLESKTTRDSQPRYSTSTIDNWRNALSCVADISGLDLEERFGGDEGELLEKIVEVVLKKVAKQQLSVAKYPTGLDEKVSDLERRVLSKPHNGRVGITGLGGVGKTTLAKEIFNRKLSNYSKSYFLSNVRENKNSLHSLQSELLIGLFQLPNLHIGNRDAGIEIVRKHLSSSKVFVVLDDVDDVDQVDALLPVDVGLHHDSLILITSRHKDVLAKSGVQESSVYTLSGLNTKHSTRLFCLHAFCQAHPLLGFADLVDEFVKACHGLPLSLKVVGATLSVNRDESYWKGNLDKLRNSLPDDIQKNLRLSYDALQKEEQHMFLDVACFLLGQNKGTAISTWNASGWNGSVGFQNLLYKCLVELDNVVDIYGSIIENCITMHDHLRDLGRDLAKRSGLSWRDLAESSGLSWRYLAKSSGLPSSLWRGTKNIEYLLQEPYNKATEVRGIRMILNTTQRADDDNEKYASSDDDDESPSVSRYKMKNLHLLDTNIEADRLECILRVMHSPNLTWLRWQRCSCPYLPSWIPVRNLRVLDMAGHFETLWQDEAPPLQLQHLHIRGSVLNIPKSIGQLNHLERMVVTSLAITMSEIPEEFCNLPSLKHLQLRISAMKSLPDSFGNLSNLEHIDLTDCCELERLPNSFGNLIKLEYLVLEGCSKLTLSSGNFRKISTLEYIDLEKCDNIQVLPSQIAHQRSLKNLYLCLPNLKEWPSAIGDPSGLETLQVGGCRKLKHLLDSIPSQDCVNGLAQLTQLRVLDIWECSELEELPILEHLRLLEELKLSKCDMLKSIPMLAQLTQLRELHVHQCRELEELPGFQYLMSLRYFRAYECVKLKSIRCSEQLTQLRELHVSECRELKELPGFQHLRSLEQFRSSGCVKLKSIRCSPQLTQLRMLDVSGCSELEELPAVEHLRSLEDLRACKCVNLKSIRCSAQLTQLQKLDVSECSELEELPGVEYLSSLTGLQAFKCLKLKSIRCSAQLTELWALDVSGCSELEELAGVEHLRSLRYFRAYKCVKLKSIRCSAQLTELQSLDVSGCSELEELAGVEHLRSLIYFRASECVKLKSIRCSAQLTELQRLDVSGCSELEELAGVEHLRSLIYFWASECVKLKSIRCSAQLTELLSLNVSGCSELEELAGVEHLRSLRYIWASECVKLKSIQGLGQLTELLHVDVFVSSELEEHCRSQLRSMPGAGRRFFPLFRGFEIFEN